MGKRALNNKCRAAIDKEKSNLAKIYATKLNDLYDYDAFTTSLQGYKG